VSYELVIFDPAAAPRERAAFLHWQERLQWTDDAATTAPALHSWLTEMMEEFPEGDPYDVPGGTDYWIGASAIYADFPWTMMEPAYDRASSLAARHCLGLFNAGLWAGEVWIPAEGKRLVLLHRAALDPQKVPYWAVRLVPYAERWNIGDDGGRGIAVNALDDAALENLAQCLDDTPEFWGWLAGESERLGSEYSKSEELLAMTVLGMAVDYAKVHLAIRRGTHRFPGGAPSP
jgi:hypothetical protein